MNTTAPTVLIAGGGTTGHISPMIAIGEELRTRYPDARIIMLGTPEGLETRLVPAAGFDLQTIAKVPAPRRIDAGLLKFPLRFAGAVRAVGAILQQNQVDVVVGVGGYVSTPAYLAAKRHNIPIVIHEANSRPGLANKLGARLTRQVGVTFAGTPLHNGQTVGMPMRAAIEALDRTDPTIRTAAAKRLGCDPKRPLLVVTGGSLGAQKINETLLATAADIVRTGFQVLHITGAGKSAEVAKAVAQLPDYHVVEYVDEMSDVYAAADLIICRAGAGTVAEVSVTGVPALYVPLAIGNGEQKLNAAGAVQAGAALLVDNAEFTPDYLRTTVLPLLAPGGLEQLGSHAAGLDFPRHAAAAMVDLIEQASSERKRQKEKR